MITHHGRARMQQRGFPRLVLDWLLGYGVEHHDHDGGIIRHFTRESRRHLEREIGREPVRRMHEWLDAYAVFSTDGALITVGHHYRRLYRTRRTHVRRKNAPGTLSTAPSASCSAR